MQKKNISLATAQITFLGAGSMAEAIIRGIIAQNKVSPDQIFAINNSNEQRLDELHTLYGIHTSSMKGNLELAHQRIQQADIVVLAMKPKDAASGLAAVQHILTDDQLLVSVIAGISITTLHAILGRPLPIVRTMPNTPSSIGMGSTGMCFSEQVEESQRLIAREMFEAIGQVVVVEESKIDLVTGLSGSGPAYVYYFIEALIQGGVQGGLDPETAKQLAVQTVIGAAGMVRTTGEDPAELRRKVTSPNGTTQAALEFMDQHQFLDTVAGAVRRSAERAQEIGEQLNSLANEQKS